jgi:hypothetical protein
VFSTASGSDISLTGNKLTVWLNIGTTGGWVGGALGG